MWTCPNCAEPNEDDAPVCAVCAMRRPPTGTRARPSAPSYPPSAPSYPAADPSYPAADPWAPAVEPITPAPTMPALFEEPPKDEHGVPRRPLRVHWVLAIATVVLVGAGVAAAIVAPRLLSARDDRAAAGPATIESVDSTGGDPTGSDTGTDTTGSDTADPTGTETADPPTEPPTEQPTEQPTAGGIVAIGPAVADGRAAGVAAMFTTYFGGINDKNYDQVGSVLDPAGSVDPTDTAEMDALARGTRSTTDSDVVLTSVGDASGGLLTAEVTFVSHQDAGDGPRGRSAETCTHWTIRYTVSDDGAYRIRKSKAASRPC